MDYEYNIMNLGTQYKKHFPKIPGVASLATTHNSTGSQNKPKTKGQKI